MGFGSFQYFKKNKGLMLQIIFLRRNVPEDFFCVTVLIFIDSGVNVGVLDVLCHLQGCELS